MKDKTIKDLSKLFLEIIGENKMQQLKIYLVMKNNDKKFLSKNNSHGTTNLQEARIFRLKNHATQSGNYWFDKGNFTVLEILVSVRLNEL